MKRALKNLNNFIKKNAYLLLFLLPLIEVKRVIDNDTWFMINHGRYILENGFTAIEPFTVHEGLAFSFEKWLSCIFFAKLYEFSGTAGMVAFLYVSAIVIEFLFYKIAYYISENKKTSLLVTITVCSVFNVLFLRTRPQTFSFILLLLEFWFTEHYANEEKWHYLLPLPVISIVYMQLHSTMWPMFFIMLMPYLFDFIKLAEHTDICFMCYSSYPKLPLWIATVVSALAGFINPYGYKSVIYLFKSTGVNDLNLISELTTTTVIQFMFQCAFVIIPIVVYIAKLIKAREFEKDLYRIPLRYIFFIGGTFLLGIYAIRNMAYFLLYAGIIGAFLTKGLELDFSKKQQKFIGVLGLLVLTASIIIPMSTPVNAYEDTYAYEELNQLAKRVGNYDDCQKVKLYTSFNTGAYAEYLGFKAYIDPRAEVFLEKVNNKEDIIVEFMNVYYGGKPYKEIQDKYQFDYWLVETNSAINTYMKNDSNYFCVNKTDEYATYKFKGDQHE